MMRHFTFLLSLLFFLPVRAEAFPPLTDLDGKPATIVTDKEKQLVVFWATWCDECRAKLSKELPLLNGRKDVSVITINTDRDESRVREFVKKEAISLPVFRDPTKALRSELKIFSVPHWAVYRRNPKSHDLELVKSEPAFDYGHVLQALGGE